jgi:hypothetical protein
MCLVYLVLLAGLDAVAVSPDGKSLAVGGDNRAAYVLDAATLEVRHRVATGARITNLALAPDGALVVEDETNTLRRLDLAGKELARLADAGRLVVSPAGDVALVRGRLTHLIGLSELEVRTTFEVNEWPAAYAFTADGKRLVVLEQSQLSDAEPLVSASAFPSKLSGLGREEYRQRHDGRISLLRIFAPDGKETDQRRLWYSSDSDSTTLRLRGGEVHVLNRMNVCARISDTVTLFQTPLRLNHAIATSADGKVLVLGGRAGGVYDAGKPVEFALDELPGKAEFVTRLAVRPDGSAYGVTSAYRVFRLSAAGKVEKVVPVY